jgi:ATP-dependent exoDNAse (exonuclease V) beta subunit
MKGTMPDDEKISLKPHWGEDSNLAPAVHHWHAQCNKDNSPTVVAQQIKAIFDDPNRIKVKPKNRDEEARPIEYKDIAILTSTNYECDKFISALLKEGLPVSSPETEIYQRAEVQLVISLLQYTIRKNKLSILNIEKLLGETPTKEIILNAIKEEDSTDTSNPLLEKIDYVVNRIKNLPITYLVKNLILELNLHEIVKKWGDTLIRQQNLNTIIDVAKRYDDECLQNGRGTSIAGFINYLNSNEDKPETDNVSNTIKVMTYHKSKGLEWPMVILASLTDKKTDEQLLIKTHICTENIIKTDSGYHILLFPKLINGNKNIPTPILDIITNQDPHNTLFKTKRDEAINEAKRLLYVGFTRARDYIVTLSNTNRNNRETLNWLVDIGVTDKGTDYENIWGVKGEYLERKVDDSATANTTYQTFNIEERPRDTRNPKFVSPSQIQYSADQEITIKINDTEGERIKLYKANDKITEIGTCLHNIFAIYDFVGAYNFYDKAEAIIINHNLMECLPNTQQIKDSIEYLYNYLSKTYGEATSIEHEVPFYHKNGEQIVHGEIDLIWHTAKGCVLVDFKSFPGSIKDILNTNNPHYAGKYAPQLSAYKAAIVAAGLNVLDSLIYYSVQGNIVKLNI